MTTTEKHTCFIAPPPCVRCEAEMAAGDPHPWYGPCDGFGPGRSCSECAKKDFATEADWQAWLREGRTFTYTGDTGNG